MRAKCKKSAKKRKKSGWMTMDRLTSFGLFAVTAMLLCYAMEDRSRWSVVALRRWSVRRQ
jgi:hypothetical protein